MGKKYLRTTLLYILAGVLSIVMVLMSGCSVDGSGVRNDQGTDGSAVDSGSGQEQVDQNGLYAADLDNEYLVGATAWQLSAESRALIEQAFTVASGEVDRMMERCNDPKDGDWTYDADQNEMFYKGKRVAVITDIDDTLVDGSGYNCDQIANGGEGSSIAFARFIQSKTYDALPGAVDFIKHCDDNGIEVYYVTNRSDLGYAVGESDSKGSYEDVVGPGKGEYIGPDGNELGASVYQCLGETMYDMSYESMKDLGFPVDDQHLIINDSKQNGSSKEPVRQAVEKGNDAYPNGQREGEGTTDTALTAPVGPHHIAMLVGDSLSDFTDDFSADDLTADSRADLVPEHAEEFGTRWILLPNAMYGSSYTYAKQYGLTELLKEHAYE